MSKQVLLTIRGSERVVHQAVDGRTIAKVIPALSADPETVAELARALRRYMSDIGDDGFFANWKNGCGNDPAAAEVCCIDLPARLVAFQWSYPQIDRTGIFECSAKDGADAEAFPYFLSDQWLFRNHIKRWQKTAQKRRRARARSLVPEARDVLYQRVIEFIAEAVFAARGQSTQVQAVDIHREWLLTPRADLHGAAPRDLALRDLQHIDMDIELVAMRMAESGTEIPALDRSSHAYRYASMGSQEWVLYYDFVRHLIQDARRHVNANATASIADTQVRLEQQAQEWLAIPQADYHNHSPAELIDKERRREPMIVDGSAAIVDHDCPLCQMMAEEMGPCFWHLDRSHVEPDFAFSTCATRAEWSTKQERLRELELDDDQADALRNKGHASSESENARRCANDEAVAPIWDRSNAAVDLADAPLPVEILLFGIGAQLAELDADLKKEPGGDRLVADLNRDFGNLRETVRESQELVTPVVEHFCDNLNRAALLCEHLADQCANLDSQLHNLADRINIDG